MNIKENKKKMGNMIFESPMESLLQALHSSHSLRILRLWLSLCLRRLFFYFTAAVPDSRPSSTTSDADADAGSPSKQPPLVVLSSSIDANSAKLASFEVDDNGGERGTHRFTVYFHRDGYGLKPPEEADAEQEEEEQEELGTVAPEAQEVFELVVAHSSFHLPVLVRQRSTGRAGDLSWYRCQDLSVLNGSVVRFWDGDT